MEITLRYFDGCPSWQVTLERLRASLQRSGVTAEIRLERVATSDDARRLGFAGSPTVLLNGVDPFAEPSAPVGLACRVYRTERGLEGSPSEDQLLAALTR